MIWFGVFSLQKPLGDNLHFSDFKVIDYPRTRSIGLKSLPSRARFIFGRSARINGMGVQGERLRLIRASRAGRSFRGSRSFGWRSRLTLRTTCKSMRCWTARVLPALFGLC